MNNNYQHIQLTHIPPYAQQQQNGMVIAHNSPAYAYPAEWLSQQARAPLADHSALGEMDTNNTQLQTAHYINHTQLGYPTPPQPQSHGGLPLGYGMNAPVGGRSSAVAADSAQPSTAQLGKQHAVHHQLQPQLDGYSSYHQTQELDQQLFGQPFESGPTFVDSTTYGNNQRINQLQQTHNAHHHSQAYGVYQAAQAGPAQRSQRDPSQFSPQPSSYSAQSMHTTRASKNSNIPQPGPVQHLNDSIGSSTGSSGSSALIAGFSRRASVDSSPASSRLHSPDEDSTVCQQKMNNSNSANSPTAQSTPQSASFNFQPQLPLQTAKAAGAEFSPARSSIAAPAAGGAIPLATRNAPAHQNNAPDAQRATNNSGAPEQPQEVPEAVFHLLRLGRPNSSDDAAPATGAEAEGAVDEVDNSCDEDAEGESDDTSVHSADGRSRSGSLMGAPLSGVGNVGQANVRVWNHDARQPPLCIPLAQTRAPSHAGSHSRQPSITSSVASTRVRQHRPARTQREQSAAASGAPGSSRRTSGGSTSMAAPPAPTANGRRTSGRARRLSDRGAEAEQAKVDSDYEPEGEVSPIDEDELDGDASVKSAKGKGKAKAPPKARGPGRKPTKRASLGGPVVSTDLGPPPAKKPRVSAPPALGERAPPAPRQPRRVVAPPSNAGQRTFPAQVEPHPGFPRFYRQFPLSSRFPPDSDVHSYAMADHPIVAAGSCLPEGVDIKWNKVNDPRNLYIARLVQGNAEQKAGLCPICVEDTARGGEGTEKWLKLKNSSYVYHLSYAHGLSNLTGKPFSPPITTRQTEMPPGAKDSRSHMTEGLCHKCDKWIPLLSVKNVDAIVPELLWWKHAKKCHAESTIPGETNAFLQDEVLDLIESANRARSVQPSAASSIHGSSQNGHQSASASIAGSHSQHQSRSASPAGSHHSNASLQSQYAPARSGQSDRYSPFPHVYKAEQQLYQQQQHAGPSNWQEQRQPPRAPSAQNGYHSAHLSPGAGQPNGIPHWQHS